MKSETKICSRCETENPGYSRYCRGCGYELPEVAVENTVTETPVKSSKKVSVGLTIGLTLGGLFIGLFLGVLIGAAASYVYNDFAGVSESLNTNRAIIDQVSNVNRNLPVMIDSETRLDNMMPVNQKTFQYTYTLVNMERGKVDTTAMKNRMEPLIINAVKTAPDMEVQRRNEMTIVYYYKDKNGNYLFSIAATPDKYK